MQDCETEPLKVLQYAADRWAIDPIQFIEQFGWLMNPKFENAVKPFFLFQYQKDVITKVWQAELEGKEAEILIDKPREMGLTWVMVWYMIWRWLFTQNWSGFILSRSESEVDDGTSDPSSSIFGKIRWSIDKLPDWLVPEGFTPKGKKGTSTDSMLRISNPQMNSTLVGSTTNQNAGRSRRYSLTFTDECFFVEHFQEVRRSLSSVSNIKVFISTSKVGRTFQGFVELCKSNGNYISLSYKDNPFKDEIWYQDKLKEAEYDPEIMREVEPTYTLPSSSMYYPELSQAKLAPLEYDRKRPLFVSLDYGKQDHTVLIWSQFDGQNFNLLECLAHSKVDFEWFTPFLNPLLLPDPLKFVGRNKGVLDRVRTWQKPLAYFGEPAHKQVHYPSNSSIQKELVKYGVKLTVNDNACSHEVRRKATSMLLPRIVFNSSSDGVMDLHDAIMNSRYAGGTKGTSKDAMMKPAHDDEVGDYRSALENLCVNSPRIMRTMRGDIHQDLKQNSFASSLFRYLKI
jgi:hypothetical protein